jgi:probable phosphoglycerate mutase
METASMEKRMINAQQRYVLPAGAREVILVRHGSSDPESNNILPFGELTLADPPLLPEGHAQAEAVARRLSGEPVSRIFVTPLQRTHQTAAKLVDLMRIDPIVVPELREAHLGDWEHEFYVRAASQDPLLKRMLSEETWDVIPNAEPMQAFSHRVRAGIEKVLSHLAAGTTAVAFVHGGTIGEVCRQATLSRPFAFFAPENTSVSRLVVQRDGRWALRCFNDVSHL